MKRDYPLIQAPPSCPPPQKKPAPAPRLVPPIDLLGEAEHHHPVSVAESRSSPSFATLPLARSNKPQRRLLVGDTTNSMPRDLGAGGVDHDYDGARITVILGIAGDVPGDAGAVLDG
ncbi:hypothetical protein ACVWWO_000972 [Bradyrhizobium sp. F1.13.1]